MTSNIFFDAVIWFFTIWGAFCLITDLFSFIASRFYNYDKYYIIVPAKNSQATIEPTLRRLISQYGSDFSLNGIVAIDLDSTDDTINIIKKLSEETDIISAVAADEVGKYIKIQ